MSLGDFTRIATNDLSNLTRFEINRTTKKLGQDFLRLSTGKRINRAEDDSASFSISSKLSARLAALEQAQHNVSDAKSMIDIMEQSLTKIADILNQVRKYIIKAANGATGPEERGYIQQSINGLANEITSIVNQSVYNGQELLLEGYSATFQVGEQLNETISLTITDDLTSQDVQVEEVTSLGALSSSGVITTATQLNALDQIEGFQAGDTFDIILTRGDGTQVTTTITGNGSKGQLSTNTIQDVIDAINGTGDFTASYSASSNGQIIVREAVVTTGNALAVNFGNFVEAPNTDGATGTIGFGFNSATGTLRSSLTSAGVITGATQINSLNQFNLIEGQDTLTINLRDRDNVAYAVTVTFSGASATTSNATVNDVINAINTQVGAKFSASLVSNQIQIDELNLSQRSFRALSSFIENSTNTGAASVSNISFAQTTQSIRQNTGAAIAGGTQLSDAVAGIGTGFLAGDSFDIQLRANDGTIETITYTFATPNDTYANLANYITSNSSFTATISGGQLRISEDTLSEGTLLNMNYQNYIGGGTFSNPGSTTYGDTIITSNGTFGGAFNTGTLLNSLPNFTNVQSGDTLTIRLTDNLGGAQNVNFVFAGASSGASTSTVNDLINAINSQTTLTASFNATLNELVVVDPSNLGNSIAMSISNADFTELPRPNNGGINLTFSYSGEAMVSNTLQSGAVNVNSGTRLTDIDGWGTLEGNDVIRINLRTRAGASANFNFTLNDVAAGNTSNLTVGNLVTFLDGRNIGAVNFSASLSGGQISIQEENSPQISMSASTSFTENNIDSLPKTFSNASFQISQFLRLASDTGLVIGLGLVDFGSGTPLTQSTASQLLQNVDDSINRVNNQLNSFGIIQNRLSNRENSLRSSIISNQSARSRMLDTDFAKTYSNMLKNRIIQQYQTASLTQANLAPGFILGLL
ncbi:hypothetical protein EP331_10705 [bacterium]|nr:MAG: hypothetical protein EP331_10705 [bacterium]